METVTIVLALALLGAVALIVWLLLGRSRTVATVERAKAEDRFAEKGSACSGAVARWCVWLSR